MFEWCDFSPKQLSVIDAPLARINILEGAVRSGKTIASIIRWFLYVVGETAEGSKLLMLGVTADTLKRNVIDDILDIVGEEHARYVDGTLYLFGRIIHCVGARDKGAEKRIRGMTVCGAYIDEVSEIPENVVEQAIMRCSKGAGRLIWTTNPDGPYHWLAEKYVKNEKAIAAGRVVVHHFDLDDNYALSDEYKADLRANFVGIWYKRMVLGLWVLADGLIYDHFDLALHGFDDADAPAEFDYLGLTADYGTQNPLHAILLGIKGESSWALDEWRYGGRESMRQKTDAEYADDLLLWLGDRRPSYTVIDPSASSFITELSRRDGLFGGLQEADNDVVPGIRTTSTRLHRGQLRIHRQRCPELVKEMGAYSWCPKAAKLGEDKPLKQKDHGPDALRYHEFTRFKASSSWGGMVA